MNRSQMRPRNSRPSLLHARTGSTTKLTSKLPTAKLTSAELPSAKPAKAGLAKTTKTAGNAKQSLAKSRFAKAGFAKLGKTRLGKTRLGKAKLGKTKLGTKHRRTPSTKTLVIAGAATCAVAGIAALPITRRTFRRLTATWQQKRHQKRQQHQMTPVGLDTLTGLPNRAEGERMLGAALERGKARGRRVALLYIDLDDFKLCNDTYGSDAGDHVLQVTAARMQAQLRSGDIVCRRGGDDFMVIMESAGPDHTVSRIAERISDAIAQPISFEGESILVGGSVGIAVAVNGEGDVNELVAHGDAAVDRARAAGRHVVQY